MNPFRHTEKKLRPLPQPLGRARGAVGTVLQPAQARDGKPLSNAQHSATLAQRAALWPPVANTRVNRRWLCIQRQKRARPSNRRWVGRSGQRQTHREHRRDLARLDKSRKRTVGVFCESGRSAVLLRNDRCDHDADGPEYRTQKEPGAAAAPLARRDPGTKHSADEPKRGEPVAIRKRVRTLRTAHEEAHERKPQEMAWIETKKKRGLHPDVKLSVRSGPNGISPHRGPLRSASPSVPTSRETPLSRNLCTNGRRTD